jgi:hypothetical protein
MGYLGGFTRCTNDECVARHHYRPVMWNPRMAQLPIEYRRRVLEDPKKLRRNKK